MRELDIDLGGETPAEADARDGRARRLVVTMGCGDECPYIPGKRYVDWELPDPKGLPVEQVRAIRDDIATRVRALIGELGE